MSEEKLVFAQNYIDGKFEECQDYLDSFNPVRNERSPLNDVTFMVFYFDFDSLKSVEIKSEIFYFSC